MGWDHLREREVDMPDCEHDTPILMQSENCFFCHDCGAKLGERIERHKRKSTMEKQSLTR